MNVLICINNFNIGGAEQLVVDEYFELKRQGYNVKILNLKLSREGSFLARFPQMESDFLVINFKSFFDIKSWIKLFAFLRKNNFELIISHLWFSNVLMKICNIFFRFKNFVILEHNVYDNVKSKKMFFIDRLTQNLVHHIIAISPAVKKSLLKFGIKESKIKLIYNGIDLRKFENVENINIRNALGINNEKFVVLMLARLIHQKGYDIALKAFSKLDKNIVLLVAGAGELENDLKIEVKNLNLEDRVFFLGRHPKPLSLLLESDLFIMPSRHEGFSIALLEAMASGKPIIVSDFDSRVGVIEDRYNGLVCAINDHESLYESIRRIYESKELGENLGRSAKESVNKFSIKSHIENILAISKN